MNPKSPAESYRVLIVEDEFLIADSIARHLARRNHVVVGKAISYDEAVVAYHRERPDLSLIDIRLSGSRNGIDVARYLRQQPWPIPFIYLTSQSDPATVDLAKDTFPSGFLSKPIQMESLLSMVSITMHNHRVVKRETTVTLRDGRVSYVLQLDDIQYLQADHVYVQVKLVNQPTLVFRSALTELVAQIGDEMLQTHRSYAVNPRCITRFTGEFVYVGDMEIPVSRSRRKEVTDRLQS